MDNMAMNMIGSMLARIVVILVILIVVPAIAAAQIPPDESRPADTVRVDTVRLPRPTADSATTDTLGVALADTGVADTANKEPVWYRVDVYVSGGYSLRLARTATSLIDFDYTYGGPTVAFRLMWKPDHLLAIGVETGYVPVSLVAGTAGGTDARDAPDRLKVSAIPVFLIAAMQYYGFEVSTGLGLYSYGVDGSSTQRLEVQQSGWEIGYMYGLSYTVTLFGKLSIGPEIRIYDFTDRPITLLVPQLRLRWSLFKY